MLSEVCTLRFASALRHPAGGLWPALVALVTDVDNRPVAIHRTYLARDGTAKAPLTPQRLMLGPASGGCVRLGPPRPGGRLLVGEGIETCLSGMQAAGLPAWAALSTAHLVALELPVEVRTMTVLADGDDAGEAAALAAARRWQNEGRRVTIAYCPRGQDVNDLLRQPTRAR